MPESSRPLRWFDLITVNAGFMALSTLSQTLTPLVAPLLVQQFVGVGRQGAAYGNLRLWTLMVALLVQSLMGMLSDHTASRFGRRRPFIVVGFLLDLAILAAISSIAGMQGEAGYRVLVILLILHMAASNTAHGALQGLIPDLVPPQQHGRYSGIKALLEVPLPVIFTSLVIGKLVANGDLRGAMTAAMAVAAACLALTLQAPEPPAPRRPGKLELAPFLRLLLMTVVFTVIILVMGSAIAWLGRSLRASGPLASLWIMGLAGFLGMLLVTAVGVQVSVNLAVGRAASAASPAYRWWVTNRLAFLIGATNIAGFALYFLQGRLRLTAQQAAEPTRWLLLVVGVFILLTAPAGGWLTDRAGHKRLTAASGLVAGLGALLAAAAPSLTLIYVGGVLIGAAAGMFYTANWALGAGLAPAGEAGRYLGISNLAGAGAGAVGAYIGGPVADFFTNAMPQNPGVGYVVLFCIYAGLFFFSVFALWRIPSAEPQNSLWYTS